MTACMGALQLVVRIARTIAAKESSMRTLSSFAVCWLATMPAFVGGTSDVRARLFRLTGLERSYFERVDPFRRTCARS